MTFSQQDHAFMARALQLAERGRYTTRPNPRVGCLIVKNGEVLAEGWHYRCGEAHAEVNALQQLDNVANAQDATVYVTLEPCAHQGRTGACAVALAEAGVSKVIYAMEDPNPLVSGQGLAILRDAGVSVAGPLLEEQAQSLNQGFIRRMQSQRPWVRCKIATSMDGRTAMASGESQWITGKAARQDVQKLRAQSCAVVTGIGSIQQDNSRLNLRREELLLSHRDDVLALPPLRVVLDTQLAIDPDAAIFQAAGTVIVFTNADAYAKKSPHLQMVNENSAATVNIECVDCTNGHVNLSQVLDVLGQKYQCNEILVEAGATLSGAFLEAGLIDEIVIYQAPILLGSDARSMVNLPLQLMQDKVNLGITDRRMVGDDLRIMAQIKTVK